AVRCHYFRVTANDDWDRYSIAAPLKAWFTAFAVTSEPLSVQGVQPVLALADVVNQLRILVDLPVHDIARMCGLGRRQFYNLLNGSSTTSDLEARIRILHSYISELGDRLGHDRAKLRSAILSALPSLEFRSFYGLAAEGDAAPLHRAYEILAGAEPSTFAGP